MVMNKLGCVCIRDAWCFRAGTKKMWHDSKCFLQKVLYVHVCMRKIGRTTRYAKLPEGTATSSMIFLMVYRLRSSQKNADAPRWKWKLLGQVKWLSAAGLVPARRQSALQGWSNVTYERPTAQDIFNGQPIKALIRALGCFILAARQKAPTSPAKKTTFFAAPIEPPALCECNNAPAARWPASTSLNVAVALKTICTRFYLSQLNWIAAALAQ